MNRKDVKAIQKLIEEVVFRHTFPTSPKLKSFEIYWNIYEVNGHQELKPNVKFEYE